MLHESWHQQGTNEANAPYRNVAGKTPTLRLRLSFGNFVISAIPIWWPKAFMVLLSTGIMIVLLVWLLILLWCCWQLFLICSVDSYSIYALERAEANATYSAQVITTRQTSRAYKSKEHWSISAKFLALQIFITRMHESSTHTMVTTQHSQNHKSTLWTMRLYIHQALLWTYIATCCPKVPNISSDPSPYILTKSFQNILPWFSNA